MGRYGGIYLHVLWACAFHTQKLHTVARDEELFVGRQVALRLAGLARLPDDTALFGRGKSSVLVAIR